MTTLAEHFAALLAIELAYAGVEEDTGFRVLEVRAIGDLAVVVGRTLATSATVAYALHVPSFTSLFADRVGVAAGAFSSELREPGGCGEQPPFDVARAIEAAHSDVLWITPDQPLTVVLASGR